MTARLLVGSANPGKVAEYRRILAGLELEVLAPGDLAAPPDEPAEDAASYQANATRKATVYAAASGIATIADDSGLEVEALRGAPGVRSRRYFGDDATAEERNAALLGLLAGVADRRARFVCVIALAQPDGAVELFDGEVRGEIATAPRGAGGFGYDPIFVIEGDGRTMAELDVAEKDQLSHRGLAGAKLRARLAAEPR